MLDKLKVKRRSIQSIICISSFIRFVLIFISLIIIGGYYIYIPIMNEFRNNKINAVLSIVEDEINNNLARVDRNLNILSSFNKEKSLFDDRTRTIDLAKYLLGSYNKFTDVYLFKDVNNYIIIKKITMVDKPLSFDEENYDYQVISVEMNNSISQQKVQVWSKNGTVKDLDYKGEISRKEIIEIQNIVNEAKTSKNQENIYWGRIIKDEDKQIPNMVGVKKSEDLYIGLEQSFSTFRINLDRLEFGKNSKIIIQTNFNEMLSLPTGQNHNNEDVLKPYEFVKIGVLSNEAIKKGYELWGDKKSYDGLIEYDFGNGVWYTRSVQLDTSLVNWKIGLFAPDSEILPKNIDWSYGIILSLFSIFLIMSISVVLLSRKLSKPINELLVSVQSFSNLELIETNNHYSEVKEVHDLIEEFRKSQEIIKSYASKIKYQKERSDFQNQEFLRNAHAIISVQDLSKKYITVNKMWEDIFLIKKVNAIGKTNEELNIASNAESDKYDQIVANGGTVEFEEIINTTDKKVFTTIKFPLLNPKLVIKGICTISIDITARAKVQDDLIKVQKELLAFKEQYQAILDNSNLVMIVKDLDGHYIMVNRYLCNLTGLNTKYFIGRKDHEIWLKDEADIYRQNDLLAVNSEQAVQVYEQVQVKGETRTFLSMKFLLKDVDGNPEALCVIASDVTDIAEAQRQIEIAKIVAEDANASKSAFLANMSHEIRTPMNAIIGFTYLCMKTELTAKQLDYLEKINKSSKSLLEIINDILDFSKIEQGKFKLNEIYFNIFEVINSAVAVVEYHAKKKGLDLIVLIDEEIPTQLIGDSIRIGQMIINLIDNAIKFTQKGSVTLIVKATQNYGNNVKLKISVIDTGIGIESKNIEKIFKPFSQIDQGMSRQFGGTGLGLVIVQRFAQLMKGNIEVQSEYGVGSTFTLTINLNKKGVTIDALKYKLNNKNCLLIDQDSKSRLEVIKTLTDFGLSVKAQNNIPDNSEIVEQEISIVIISSYNLLSEDNEKKLKELSEQNKESMIVILTDPSDYTRVVNFNIPLILEPLSTSSLFDLIINISDKLLHPRATITQSIIQANKDEKRVLIVEDNEINSQIATELLSVYGLYIDVVKNGIEAVENIKNTEYDIIFMDIEMPIMNGVDATKIIRKNEKYINIPIIAMTANAMIGDKEMYISSGMNDYISKPINPDVLDNILKKYIKFS